MGNSKESLFECLNPLVAASIQRHTESSRQENTRNLNDVSCVNEQWEVGSGDASFNDDILTMDRSASKGMAPSAEQKQPFLMLTSVRASVLRWENVAKLFPCLSFRFRVITPVTVK